MKPPFGEEKIVSSLLNIIKSWILLDRSQSHIRNIDIIVKSSIGIVIASTELQNRILLIIDTYNVNVWCMRACTKTSELFIASTPCSMMEIKVRIFHVLYLYITWKTIEWEIDFSFCFCIKIENDQMVEVIELEPLIVTSLQC